MGDILFFGLALTFFTMELTNQMINYHLLHLYRGPNAVYWAFTGGLAGVFLLIKCFYGVVFLWTSTAKYRSRHIRDTIEKNRKGRVLKCT